MTASAEFLEHLRDMLDGFGPFAVRRMFGGAGLFRDGIMFALVADDVLYLKADDASRPAFEAAGSSPFTYDRKGRAAVAMSYWRAPEEDMDDVEALCGWAVKGWEAARRVVARKQKPRKRGRPA
jgi:DNA transformation protein